MKAGDILVTTDTDLPLIPEEKMFSQLVNRHGQHLFRISKIMAYLERDGTTTTEVFLVQMQHHVETHVPMGYVKNRFKVYMTAEQACAERLMQ